MNDVPDRSIRNLIDGTSYPSSSRYTLQWLASDHPVLRTFFPNNNDAAFMSHHEPKPSDLLLHYNYGAAAVKYWGRNQAVLDNLPRPHALETVAMGPTKSVDDTTEPAGNGGGTGSAAATDSRQPGWDEDDVILFFWGNSMPSMERHGKKEERNENINKWRAGSGQGN